MKIATEDVLRYHENGKIALQLTKQLDDAADLSLAYTPGVARAVEQIAANPADAFNYTAKSKAVAVVTDGTAILGLGDLGALASIPVMEGKCVLFKRFGRVDAWPVPLAHCRVGGADTGRTDPQRVIDAVCAIAPMYGGINLEDIAAPACFEIEDRLDAMLDIPVFHDDQWGTAVITLAGVINYARLADRKLADLRVVINGAGAAGIRIADMLKAAGVQDLVMCDSKGAIIDSRCDLNDHKRRHAICASSVPAGAKLADVVKGRDVFVGVSKPDTLKPADVLSMADFPAIFAMANPDPEILPEVVAETFGKKPYVMATGRSDYPNQINNVLGFPYIFRGALDAHAKSITTAMKVAAAEALAALAREDERFGVGRIIPDPFDARLIDTVPIAVAKAAAI